MKKLLFYGILLTALFSCEKEEEKVEVINLFEVVPGGCAVDDAGQITLKSASIEDKKDTVTYTVSDGNLDLLVGFNGGCCKKHNTTSTLKNDTICIDISIDTLLSQECDCDCYYTYNFKYSGITKAHPYKVHIYYFTLSGVVQP